MEFRESVAVLLYEPVEHFEENLQFLLALLVVFEGEMDFSQVEEQSHQQRSELHVVEVGEITQGA